MYSTTQQFKDSIYAPARTIHGKVTFDISDITIPNDTIITTVSSQSPISDKSQLTDKKRVNSYNLATLENNRFKLDGSFTFPDDVLANNQNVGWCSNELCDGNGVFSTTPTLTFAFGMNHNSAGITVTFESLQNEYATDFDVIAYDGSGNTIYTTSITGNTETLVQVNGQFSNYQKISVIIKKWSTPYRRARVAEVDFGIVQVYTDSELVSMNLVEEVDIISASLPSPEFTFTVDNSNRLFNILNPTGFFKYLQQRQQVTGELGLDLGNRIEWIPVGNYLLWEWRSNEGSLTATFINRTNLDLMDNYTYQNLTAKTNYSLYQFAVDIFAYCGILNYSIDPALQNIMTNALVQSASCKDILQMIAIAGCANIFVSRDNKITLKCITNLNSAVNDTITMDQQYQEPKIELQKVVKTVNVTYYSNLSTSSVVTVNAQGVNLGDTLNIDSNTLINTSTQATNVANWILQQSQLRSKYTLDWRGNPSQEMMDTLSFENSYGPNMSAFLTKNTIDYQGYLQVLSEARGVTN